MKIVLPFVTLLGVLLVGGCGDAAKKQNQEPAKGSNNNNADPAKPAKVELVVAKFDKIEGAIAEQKGKVVVVDVWATTCPPCVREFPNLVKLNEAESKNGVVCMSVTMDDVDDKAAALEFLEKKGATFRNYLVEDPAAATKKWSYEAIPVVVVYGRDGKLARKFGGSTDAKDKFSYEDVGKLVKELIK